MKRVDKHLKHLTFFSDEEDFTLLKNIADELGQAAISGNLSQSIGFNVSSLGVVAPPPPSSDPEWNEVKLKPVKETEIFFSDYFLTIGVCF